MGDGRERPWHRGAKAHEEQAEAKEWAGRPKEEDEARRYPEPGVRS